MDSSFGVFRTGAEMERGLAKIRELKKRFQDIRITDTSPVYNTDLVAVYELENMLDIAEALAIGALAREESRGSHARRDFPKRDDEKWLKHTLVYRNEDGSFRLDYKPVTITAWLPVERKY
jgi:succinate dehydrogenase/fumarate reductase flavoprotein subunit